MMKEKTPVWNKTQTEHILVCLSASPSNPKVIKEAAKMANVFNADFTALFIETPQHKKMNEENKKRLEQNTKLARENGAKIVTVDGEDVAYQVSIYAKTSGISKIIIGRSGYRPNRFFSSVNFVDKLIEATPDVDIYVIPDKIQKVCLPIQNIKKERFTFKLNLKDTITMFLILSLSSLIGWIFFELGINETNIVSAYLLGVFMISYITESKAYSLIASILTVLLYNFFFTVPYFTLSAIDPQYPLTFVMMFFVAFFTSSITKKLKEQSRQASLKAYSTEIMLEMSQRLQKSQNENEISKITVEQIQKLLDCEVVLYSFEKGELINSSNKHNTANDIEIVRWVFENNSQAGASTQKYSKSQCFYLPISGLGNVFAVIAIFDSNINEFKKNLLIAMLRESALSYEKELVSQSNNELLVKHKQEELRSTLLRAISHDLRTPLTGISGFADILMKNSELLDEGKKQQIYSDIYDDSIWLLKLVENILSITRFDKNEISIKRESEFMYDVIMEALSHLDRKKGNYKILTNIEDESLSARIDARLIIQVIFNLVDNAMKYSPFGTSIIVGAKASGSNVEISVADEGNGISDNDKQKIFDMFYTANSATTDSRRGLGLGLALCKAVVKAHGGEISIKDNHPKGTVFSFIIEGDFSKDF